MRKHCALISVAVLALWVSLPDVAYPITVVYPDKANYVHSSVCPKGDGWNHLNPDPVKNANEYFLLDAPSNALKDELAGGDTSYAGWTFNYNDSTGLNGTLTIDVYKSRFVSAHYSGAEINIRYKKATGDPANLRWVQLISTNDPIDPNDSAPPPPPTSPYIDPFPDDPNSGPFYYNDDSTSIYWVGYHLNGYADYGFGTDYDLHFYDFPMRYHPPASHVSWQAELYLCSWDGTTTVTFYDFGGIQWGFEAACVPEPLTVISMGLAIAAVFVRVRRRRR